jgi:hypothetical protein
MRSWNGWAVLSLVSLGAACATGPSPARGRDEARELTVDLPALEAELVAAHDEGERDRIARGLRQVHALWRPSDGDLAAFARTHFLPRGPVLEATFARLQAALEQLNGAAMETQLRFRWHSDVDTGPLLPVDAALAAFDPAAHANEDLFRTGPAFVALLNFPLTTLEERIAQGATWTRAQWAQARLTGRFARRVPGEVQQAQTRVGADADLYIAQYNLWMHHVLGADGSRPFPRGKRLISHWNLRDELKAAYADGEAGLLRQRLIAQVMARIVTQTIPRAVIDNPRVDWEPVSNLVRPAPAETIEQDAPAPGPAAAAPTAEREQDVRYAHLLRQFQAARGADPYSPTAPTAIARAFQIGREMPEARVEALFEALLTSPLVAKVAQAASARLGRPLEPHDLWFDGFKPRAAISEQKLDALTRARYPTAEAFARDMPRMLKGLGFSPEKATWLAERIRVDPSRGAGHAMPAARRGDFPRLRTRVEKEGMDYKGYNIAVHELGHNVEQVFSLYGVDHTLLAGVPNNAFTEALAFVFQARDLELLGMPLPDAESRRQKVLGDFWQAWEMAGVSLVDLAVWRWLYANPDATAAQLREATVRISGEVWDRYYRPVLGGEGSVLLGIYSHMIAYPLYLPDYPLGRMIAFQIEEHMAGVRSFGDEFERMTVHGAVTPDAWMVHATGEPVSEKPLLRAVERALGPSK